MMRPSFGAPEACFRTCSPTDPLASGGLSRQAKGHRLGEACQATLPTPCCFSALFEEKGEVR